MEVVRQVLNRHIETYGLYGGNEQEDKQWEILIDLFNSGLRTIIGKKLANAAEVKK